MILQNIPKMIPRYATGCSCALELPFQ